MKSINSLLNQTYKNLEIIIVDDGSTDETIKVVNSSFNNENIYIYSKENSGVSDARNIGIQKSTGDYICFLDSDDEYKNTFISKMYSKIIKHNSNLVYSGFYSLKGESVKTYRNNFTNRNVLEKYLKNIINPSICSMLFRKSFIVENSIQFQSGLNYSEDVEFVIKALSLTEKINYVSEDLFQYNMSDEENSLSSFSLNNLDIDFNVINRIIQLDYFPKTHLKMILDYRLNAIMTNAINHAIGIGIDQLEIYNYIEKYRYLIFGLNKTNRLRSIKINLIKIRILSFYLTNKRKVEDK